MDETTTIANVMDDILTIKGVVDAVLLPSSLKKSIQDQEKADECQANGLFMKVNTGIKEVMKREVLVGAMTNEEYVYPPEPVELVYMGDTVGEEIRDKSKLEDYKKDPNAMLLGDSFVIYKDKMPKDNLRKAITGDIKIMIPPMSVGLKDEEGVYGLVLAMPCTQTDVMLREWLKCQGINLLDKQGIILIGFNLLK
jgi:hypothetical protein